MREYPQAFHFVFNKPPTVHRQLYKLFAALYTSFRYIPVYFVTVHFTASVCFFVLVLGYFLTACVLVLLPVTEQLCHASWEGCKREL